MTQTKSQDGVLPSSGHHWQDFNQVDYPIAGYHNLDPSQVPFAQDLDIYSYPEPARQTYHPRTFIGEEYMTTLPQRTFVPRSSPFEATYNSAYVQMQNPAILHASMHTTRHNTPWSATESSAYSPPVYVNPNSNLDTCYAQPPTHHRTISMTDVQPSVDGIPDATFDIERAVYKSPGNSSFEPCPPIVVTTFSSPEPASTEEDAASQDDDSDYVDSKAVTYRRSGGPSSPVTRRDQKRVTKRPTKRRRSTHNMVEQFNATEDSMEERLIERPFHCPLAPYGCPSTFGSKNEWKRHFSTQHMRLGFWRCDKCPTGEGKKSNNFNRKDLFMQHVRRMHTDHKQQHCKPNVARKSKNKQSQQDDADQIAIDAAIRCHKKLRSPPAKSVCVVCSELFSGPTSWDKRMEHMGRHFEAARRGVAEDLVALHVDRWDVDNALEDWMIKQRILLRAADGSIVINHAATRD